MFCDDRPDYPMTGFFRLRFSQRLDFCAMDAAIQATLARHPLLRSKVRRDAHDRLCWEPVATDSIPFRQWSADSQTEYPAAEYVDLTRSAGTRIWLVDRNGTHDLVVQIHHSCTDALGMCQMISDLLLIYARQAGSPGSDVELPPLDNERLLHRNRFGLTWGKLLRMLPSQILGLSMVGKFLSRKAASLGLSAADQTSDEPVVFPSPSTFDFDRCETAAILAEARRKRATVNDLLARDLFLALNTWRNENGAGINGDWLRFFVPLNQRTEVDQTMSAANVISAVFLERNPQQLAEPEILLRSIQAEMLRIRSRQLGLLFIAAHTLFSRFPRLRNHIIGGGKCVSSCVFSNLGVILNRTPLSRQDGKLAIGDILLDGVDFIAPVRPQTSAAFCVYTYAGRLSVNLHCDSRAISKHQADELLRCVVRQIRGSLQGAPPKESSPVADHEITRNDQHPANRRS